MVLDRLLAQVEAGCDLFVGESCSHQLQYLVLTFGEGRSGIVDSNLIHKSPGGTWIEGRLTARRRPDGVEQQRRSNVLAEVAVGSRSNRFEYPPVF